MHIQINDQTKFISIQQTFSNFYPFLRIEFYRKSHLPYMISEESKKINPDLCIASVKKTHTDCILEIQPSQQVRHLEKEIEMKLGLGAQIFRKENKGWRETAGEDDFTLMELNRLGRNASDEYILEEEDIDPGEEKPEKLF